MSNTERDKFEITLTIRDGVYRGRADPIHEGETESIIQTPHFSALLDWLKDQKGFYEIEEKGVKPTPQEKAFAVRSALDALRHCAKAVEAPLLRFGLAEMHADALTDVVGDAAGRIQDLLEQIARDSRAGQDAPLREVGERESGIERRGAKEQQR